MLFVLLTRRFQDGISVSPKLSHQSRLWNQGSSEQSTTLSGQARAHKAGDGLSHYGLVFLPCFGRACPLFVVSLPFPFPSFPPAGKGDPKNENDAKLWALGKTAN